MAHQFCWELVFPMVSPRFCKERPPADSPREERYTGAGGRAVLSRLGPLQHLSDPRAPGLAAAIPTMTEVPPQLVSVGAAAPPPSTLGSHFLPVPGAQVPATSLPAGPLWRQTVTLGPIPGLTSDPALHAHCCLGPPGWEGLRRLRGPQPQACVGVSVPHAVPPQP